jgi:glycine/D-amino acid oxidase-like deaminating enzyme
VPFNKPVRRIAIIGTGVIGASWSAFYLALGFTRHEIDALRAGGAISLSPLTAAPASSSIKR